MAEHTYANRGTSVHRGKRNIPKASGREFSTNDLVDGLSNGGTEMGGFAAISMDPLAFVIADTDWMEYRITGASGYAYIGDYIVFVAVMFLDVSFEGPYVCSYAKLTPTPIFHLSSNECLPEKKHFAAKKTFPLPLLRICKNAVQDFFLKFSIFYICPATHSNIAI